MYRYLFCLIILFGACGVQHHALKGRVYYHSNSKYVTEGYFIWFKSSEEALFVRVCEDESCVFGLKDFSKKTFQSIIPDKLDSDEILEEYSRVYQFKGDSIYFFDMQGDTVSTALIENNKIISFNKGVLYSKVKGRFRER
jgi:hypothetical protein